MRPEIQIDPAIRARLRAVALEFGGMEVEESPPAHLALCRLAGELRRAYEGASTGSLPMTQESRRLYREFGIDPTRTRPSSEALLRRALRGLELYRISNLVDAGNLVSLRWQLSLGLYDADRIGVGATLRLGGANEGYVGIRKDWVNLSGRLCLADAVGPFGSPTSDSERTSVGLRTSRVLAILFAPADGDLDRLREAARDLGRTLTHFAGGELVASREFL